MAGGSHPDANIRLWSLLGDQRGGLLLSLSTDPWPKSPAPRRVRPGYQDGLGAEAQGGAGEGGEDE